MPRFDRDYRADCFCGNGVSMDPQVKQELLYWQDELRKQKFEVLKRGIRIRGLEERIKELEGKIQDLEARLEEMGRKVI